MIILNKKHEILDKLKEELSWAEEIDICVSYITDSGIKNIIKLIEGKKVRIITTTDDYITTPSVLELLNKKFDVRVIQKETGRGFHTKFIELRKGSERKLMIGSLNLTQTALFKKYESVSIDNLTDQETEFEYLWNLEDTWNVEDIIKQYKFEFNIYNEVYSQFEKNVDSTVGAKPNEMQIPALVELEKLRKNKINRALLWSATGTGKTYLSAFDSRQYGFKKLLFIVHNRAIIASAKKDYEKFYPYKQILELKTENVEDTESSDIIFSTEKTLKIILETKPNYLDQYDYVIFDEVHKLGEENIQGEIFRLIKEDKSKFILGMTATPNRSDDPEYLFSQFENIVGKIDTEKAMELGLICKFNYYGVDVEPDFNVKELNNNDLELMIQKFVNKLETTSWWDKGNVTSSNSQGGKLKGIIFTSTIKEATEVKRRMTELGYRSEAIHSQDNTRSSEIEKQISDLQSENTDLNFLVTVNKFNEGVDIPKINTIGMFRFTSSSIIYTQQIGRGLRTDGNPDKYLNIIDLVGNQKVAFERMAGLKGKKTIDPLDMLEEVVRTSGLVELDENIKPLVKNERIYLDFELTKLAALNIIKSLSNIKYEKFYTDKLLDKKRLFGREIILSEIEDDLGDSIQLISNNVREKATHKFGEKSWFSKLLEGTGLSIDDITLEEHQLIEAYSWFPFTVSTSEEKKKILSLLNGKRVSMNAKWISYFVGRNILSEKESQIIKGDFSKFYKFDKTNAKSIIEQNGELEFSFIPPSNLSNSARMIFDQIRDYLTKYQDRNDNMIRGSWYSKVEISFFAGYTANVNKGYFKKYKEDKTIGENTVFITNDFSKKKNKFGNYENEILSREDFILSSTNKNKPPERDVNVFLGTKLFNRDSLFNFVGEIKEGPSFHDDRSGEFYDYSKNGDYEKVYSRFKVTASHKLSQRDYIYLKYHHLIEQMESKIVTIK